MHSDGTLRFIHAIVVDTPLPENSRVTLATLQSKKWDIHMDADSNFRISELMNLPTEAPLRSELKI